MRLASWSTLVMVMACCLMAPSHYLNQWWAVLWVLWKSHEGNVQNTSHWIVYKRKSRIENHSHIFQRPRDWIQQNSLTCNAYDMERPTIPPELFWTTAKMATEQITTALSRSSRKFSHLQKKRNYTDSLKHGIESQKFYKQNSYVSLFKSYAYRN